MGEKGAVAARCGPLCFGAAVAAAGTQDSRTQGSWDSGLKDSGQLGLRTQGLRAASGTHDSGLKTQGSWDSGL